MALWGRHSYYPTSGIRNLRITENTTHPKVIHIQLDSDLARIWSQV